MTYQDSRDHHDGMTHQDSDDHRVIENGEIVVKADTEERQAAEVKPMRYVLAIGLIAVIVGMAVSYMTV